MPQLNRQLVLELMQGGYIAAKENVLMAGEIGTGNPIPTNDPTGPNCSRP